MLGLEGTCKTCKYWNNIFNEENECRRFPPQIVYETDLGKIITRFPNTRYYECCGEYKEKANATK